MTHESQVEFKEKVKLNDTVRADARVIDITDKHYIIEVNSYVSDMLVLKVNSKCTIQVRMNEMVKIAVDMMGGDDAPGIVLDAVKKLSRTLKIWKLFFW